MEMSAGSGAYTAKMEKISAMSEIHNDIGPRLVDSSGLLKAAELDNRMKASLKAQGDKVLGQINIYQVSKYSESFVKLNKVLEKVNKMVWFLRKKKQIRTKNIQIGVNSGKNSGNRSWISFLVFSYSYSQFYLFCPKNDKIFTILKKTQKVSKPTAKSHSKGAQRLFRNFLYENLGYYQADWLRKFDTMKWTMHSSMKEIIPIEIKNDKAPHQSIWDHSFLANMLKPMSLMLPMMTCWRAMVNKEYPLQTNFNWNDIANYGIVTEKLDLLEKDQSGLLLYTWMTIQTSSFIWQFHRDPREKFRKGVWIVAPLGVYAFGSFLLEDRASALLVALTANAIATAGIKSYARSDDFRKTYGLNTYKQDIEIIKDMQTKQKEAKLLYTGIPENLIPEEYKRFVPKAKQGSQFMDQLQTTIEGIAPMQGGTSSSGKDSNKLLYRRHALANSNSQMSAFQAKEFDEFQKIKNKTFSPTKWWRYSLREKHDRKILGFIPQKGYRALGNIEKLNCTN